jgi:hypothetical protein
MAADCPNDPGNRIQKKQAELNFISGNLRGKTSAE